MTTEAATDADGSGAHPRFAEALREHGIGEPAGKVRGLPDLVAHAGAAPVDVRERTA
ncbi:hypothetical protein ACGFT2_10110 [Streptomyces sp. NPDC048514]|uniref:hypothetical protein n=1 Tax=Streptomyces sp. NPDC048514 TaxID=3365564 RepID=UPI00371B648A